MAQAFLSYSRRDKKFATKLRDLLEDQGLDLWVDLDGLYAGEEFWPTICEAIDASANFLFLASPDSVASKHCMEELDRAVEGGKRVFPVIYREVDGELPKALAARQWTFMRDGDPWAKAAEALAMACHTDVAWMRDHTQWLVRARKWDGGGRNNSSLLRGRELAAAEEWLGLAPPEALEERDTLTAPPERTTAPRVTGLHREYVRLSRRASIRRRRWVSAIVIVGGAALLAMALVNVQRQKQRNEARSVSLAEQAQSALEDRRPEEALRLSLSAFDTWDTFEARESLLASLADEPRTRLSLPAGHGAVQALRFDPAGKRLAMATCNVKSDEGERQNAHCAAGSGTIGVWELTEGPPRWRELTDTSWVVRELSFGDAGSTLRWADAGGEVHWLDIERETTQSEKLAGEKLEIPFAPVWKVASSGEVLVAANWENSFTIWDLTARSVIAEVSRRHAFAGVSENMRSAPGALAVGPESRRLVLESDPGGGLVLRDVDDEASGDRTLSGHTGRIRSLAFDPEGTLLASSASDDRLLVWDLASSASAPVSELSVTGAGWVGFSPDGTVLAAAACSEPLKKSEDSDGPLTCRRGEVRLFDPRTREPAASPFRGHRAAVVSLAFGPDGSVASGDALGKVIWWTLEPRPAAMSFAAEVEGVAGAAFSETGSVLTVGSAGLSVLDPSTGSVKSSAPLDSDLVLHPGAFDARAGLVAAGGCSRSDLDEEDSDSDDSRRLRCRRGAFQVWKIGSGEPGAGTLLLADGGRVNAIAIRPDGSRLATARADRRVALWKRSGEDWRLEVLLDGHKTGILGLSFSPNGEVLASRDHVGLVVLWNAESGHKVGHLDGKSGLGLYLGMYTGTAVFCPDVRRLATAHREAGLVLVEPKLDSLMADPVPMVAPSDSAGGAYSPFEDSSGVERPALACGPSGRLLASSGPDRTVKLWDTADRRSYGRPLTGHPGRVGRLAFSADGLGLAAAGEGTLTVWSLDPTFWRQQTCRAIRSSASADETLRAACE